MQLWPRRAVLTSLLRLALFSAFLLKPAIASAQNDWPMFGHDDASTRFSPLNQINTENVTQLQQAWIYHLSRSTPVSNTAGPVGHGGGRRYSEATPIAANGLLYLPTPYGTVVALNPDKGTEVWSYKLTTGRALHARRRLLARR